jgi:hypothetical protein
MNEEIKKDIVEIKKILFLLYKEIACNFDKMAEISIFSEQLSREIERFSILIEENGQITAPTLSDGIQIISKENLSLQSRPNYKNSLYNQHSIDYSYIESNKYQSLLKQLEGENKIMVSLREKNTPTSFIQFCTSAINSMESIITELFDAEYLCLHNDKSDKKFLMAYDKLCQAYKAKKFTLPPDIYVNNCTNIQSNDYIKICDNKYISKKQFEQLKHKTQESIEIFFYIIDINYQQKQC